SSASAFTACVFRYLDLVCVKIKYFVLRINTNRINLSVFLPPYGCLLYFRDFGQKNFEFIRDFNDLIVTYTIFNNLIGR
ncbi:MAG: hypothetical protein ACM3QX_08825, partial [Syntrophomonadaceae bacterium]